MTLITPKKVFTFFLFFLFFFSQNNLHAGDPDIKYSTISTEHFRIHYHQGLRHTALSAASILEEIHARLSIILEWEVDEPTHVVISDSTDSANGWARSAPYPLVHIYAVAPGIGSSLAYHDNWLRTLLVHEYTHIVHTRIHSGLSAFINNIFGDIYLPNQILPRWFVEGLAVLDETYETTMGRIRSSDYKMKLRADALDGNLLTLGELSNSNRRYPRGQRQYLYGAMFMNYLKNIYGMEKIVEICHRYGRAPFPYGINKLFKKVTGTDLITNYDNWINKVKKDAFRLKSKLEEKAATKSVSLTTDGESKGSPIFTPDGKNIIYAAYNARERSGIFKMDYHSGKRKKLALSGGSSRVTLDKYGRIFFVRSAPFKNNYHFLDVFFMNSENERPVRLTRGFRARSAAISPGGTLLAVLSNIGTTTNLYLADDRGNILKTLVKSKKNDQVFAPAWSPDEKKIAVVFRRGPQVDLGIINVENNEIHMITRDMAIENSPSFGPEGRYLYYSSDMSGISNIYAYDIKDERLLKITNSVTGAFSPAVSPDGKKMVFRRYSSNGFDLHIMDLRLESATRVALVKQKKDYHPQVKIPSPETLASESYNPILTMMPRSWRLNIESATGIGMSINGVTSVSDATQRYYAAADATYFTESKSVTGRMSLYYTGFTPVIYLGAGRTVSNRLTGYEIDAEPHLWTQDTWNANAGISYPLMGLDRSQSVSVSYWLTYSKPREDLSPYEYVTPDPSDKLPIVPQEYFRAGLRFTWGISDYFYSPQALSTLNGYALNASLSLYHPSLGGEQTLGIFSYNYSIMREAPWLSNHVLSLKTGGGIRISDPPHISAYTAGGYHEQNIIDAIWNLTSFGTPNLRGYLPSSFFGDRYHSLRLNYRFPLWFAEKAYATLPLFLRDIYLNIFSDNILIGYDKIEFENWRGSLGAELKFILTLGYYMPVSFKFSYAHGFMEKGINEFIFAFSGGGR